MTTQDGASGGTPTPLTLLMTALGSLTKLESPSEKSWRMLSIFLVAFFFVVGAPAAVAVAVGVTEAPGRRGGIISRMLIVGGSVGTVGGESRITSVCTAIYFCTQFAFLSESF